MQGRGLLSVEPRDGGGAVDEAEVLEQVVGGWSGVNQAEDGFGVNLCGPSRADHLNQLVVVADLTVVDADCLTDENRVVVVVVLRRAFGRVPRVDDGGAGVLWNLVQRPHELFGGNRVFHVPDADAVFVGFAPRDASRILAASLNLEGESRCQFA